MGGDSAGTGCVNKRGVTSCGGPHQHMVSPPRRGSPQDKCLNSAILISTTHRAKQKPVALHKPSNVISRQPRGTGGVKKGRG